MHLEDPLVRTAPGASQAPSEPETEPRTAPRALPPNRSRLEVALSVGVIAALALGIFLRFWTPSALWLDEALTVDIARAPLSAIPGLLRDDGAPPLYYFLLHYWMAIFGQGNLATRSLAGVIGVINLPIAWLTGYRVGSRWWSLDESVEPERSERTARGRYTAWAVTLLVASSPFAVYYDTEARMYGLVILLGTLLILSITSLLHKPSVLRAAGLGVVTSALLYSHYWSLYAIAVVGVAALWCSIRGPHERAFRFALGGIALGCLSFVPWLPTLWFQIHHTGTPWAASVGLTAIIYAVTQFAGGDSDPGRALAIVFFFLALLAVTGSPLDRWRVVLDLRTKPGVRAIAFGLLVSLALGLIASRLSGSTFADRYTSALVFPTLVVVAYGLTALSDRRLRDLFLAVAVLFGFMAAVPNAFLSRTQAGQAGAAIAAIARPGDVVAYCPDQLGPAVSRVLGGKYDELAFPRGNAPEIVDWVDYLKVVRAATPGPFVKEIEARAGATGTVFLVWAPGYVGFAGKCQEIAGDLKLWPGHKQHLVLRAQGPRNPFEIYEGETVDRFSPK